MGLLLGVLIGRSTAPAPSEQVVSSSSPGSGSGTSGRDKTSASKVIGGEETKRNTSGDQQFEPVQSETGAVARIQLALSSSHQISSMLRILGATSQLTKEEIPEIIALAERYDGEERELLLIGAIGRWAELDPQGGAEWIKKQGRNGRSDRQMYELALSEWGAHDPAAAKGWIEGLEDKDQKEAAMRGYYGGLAARDPAAALREISTLPGDRNRELYQSVFRSWARKDIQTAGAQAALLSDQAARMTAAREVSRIWGAEAPKDAMGWVQRLPDKELQRDLARDILSKWASREPKEAMAHLLTLPTEMRDEAASSLVEEAAKENFDDARRFAEQLPAGSARDETLMKIANQWAGRDPA
ncbi:MAG: hypothetical protein EOP84_34375, partial [Verrucomicrobiaceae bacterium]